MGGHEGAGAAGRRRAHLAQPLYLAGVVHLHGRCKVNVRDGLNFASQHPDWRQLLLAADSSGTKSWVKAPEIGSQAAR